MDSLKKILSRASATAWDVVECSGSASGYLEAKSMYVRIYVCLRLVRGRGPTMSSTTLWNDSVNVVVICIGAVKCVLFAVFWQHSQDWHARLMSLAIPGQQKFFMILYCVGLVPRWPAIGVECAIMITSCRWLTGNTICVYFCLSWSVVCLCSTSKMTRISELSASAAIHRSFRVRSAFWAWTKSWRSLSSWYNVCVFGSCTERLYCGKS